MSTGPRPRVHCPGCNSLLSSTKCTRVNTVMCVDCMYSRPCVINYTSLELSQGSRVMMSLLPTWVSWCVWHAPSGGGGAAQVHQDHGGGALRHDDRAPAPPHPEHLLLGARTLLAPPSLSLAQPLARPPASSGPRARARLVPGAPLLLLGQSLAPSSFSRPENI